MEKECKKCKEIKSLAEFYKDKRHKDGLMSWCKGCHNEVSKIYKLNNKEKYSEYQKEYMKRTDSDHKFRDALRAVYSAKGNGTISCCYCAICGEKEGCHAHHPFKNYRNKLGVIYLCLKHHKMVHKYENCVDPILSEKLLYDSDTVVRIEKSIEFYLSYHKITGYTGEMIKGNIMNVIRNEFDRLK